MLRVDVGPDVDDGLIGHAGRVGPHIGNKPDRPFARQLNALVELLRDHHRLLDREACSLLQLAGDERRRRLLLPLFCS